VEEVIDRLMGQLETRFKGVEAEIRGLQERYRAEVTPMIEDYSVQVKRLWAKKDFYFQDSMVLENNDQVGFVLS
jgi:hypothetical protein